MLWLFGEEFVNDEGHEDYRRVLTDKGRRNISFMTWLLAEPGLGCLLDYVKEKSEGADSYPEKIRPAISVFADNVKRGYNAFNLSSLAMGKKERAREEKWVEGSSNFIYWILGIAVILIIFVVVSRAKGANPGKKKVNKMEVQLGTQN